MTTKKKAQGGAKDKTAERARAIVLDVRNYSYDARLKLARALRDFEAGELYQPTATLKRMVEQAEAGSVVEGPYDAIGEDWEGVGNRAERLLETVIPDWLRDAICSA